MGYAHIDNLYKNQSVLLFRRVYALEKIHGTSSHLEFSKVPNPSIHYFSGGEKFENFRALFDNEALLGRFAQIGAQKLTVFGEAYGGKQQKMSATYGPKLHFTAFEVMIDNGNGEYWLDVPNAHAVCDRLGLEFVPYVEIECTLENLNKERDRDSEIAIRRGMGPGHKREGIVVRPTVEVTTNNGSRIVAKHKRDDFMETATPRPVVDPSTLKVLEEARAIATEWVTPMRLEHVLDKLPKPVGMEHTRDVIRAMQEDVLREAKGEIVPSGEALKEIGKATAVLLKKHLQESIVHE